MKFDSRGQTAKRFCLWTFLVICLAVILGGCQAKEAPLSKQAQVVKKTLLGEMNKLTGALAEPVAKQDWQALEPILQSSYQEMKKHRGFVPLRIVVLDRDGIIQKRFPPTRQEALDFSNYESAKIVFEQKRITTARLYMEGEKIFIVMAPLLQQDQVIGAVVMGFSEGELQKWQVPEKEFRSIDFNQ
jgi:sensor histidine kinase regulating citrate/malate metabolism